MDCNALLLRREWQDRGGIASNGIQSRSRAISSENIPLAFCKGQSGNEASYSLLLSVPTHTNSTGEEAQMKAEVLARALTSNGEYTKIGNFVDKPLPPLAVKRCTITTATQPRSYPSISISELLSRQNRKLLKMVGDGNCFFRAIATLFYGSQEKHADVRNEVVGHIGQTSFLHSCPGQHRCSNILLQ